MELECLQSDFRAYLTNKLLDIRGMVMLLNRQWESK